jgi:hypothetical protein
LGVFNPNLELVFGALFTEPAIIQLGCDRIPRTVFWTSPSQTAQEEHILETILNGHRATPFHNVQRFGCALVRKRPTGRANKTLGWTESVVVPNLGVLHPWASEIGIRDIEQPELSGRGLGDLYISNLGVRVDGPIGFEIVES